MTCDPDRPLRQNCDEIPVSSTIYFFVSLSTIKYFFFSSFFRCESISLINSDYLQGYDVAGVAPDFVEGPPPKPCQICPQGPPGFNGTDVSDNHFLFFTEAFQIFDFLLIQYFKLL